MTNLVNAGWVMPDDLHHLTRTGSRSTVVELIDLFKQDVASRLQSLRDAVMSGDLAAAASQAHTIKGSAIQMGAHNLVATCRHLELDAAHNVTENLERLLAEAEAELRVLQTTMQDPRP
jgi:HPt (histidine-containing phosphotransfer) domain-containing protein